MEQKVVLLHGFEDDALLEIVRAVKNAVPDPENIAFASTTEVNLGWKVESLIEHVGEEHAAWKRRRSAAP